MSVVGYVSKVKDSSILRAGIEPAIEVYQRHFYSPPLYQLSYQRKAYEIRCLKDKNFFSWKTHELEGNLLQNSMIVFLLKADCKKTSFKEYKQKQMKVVIYTKIL